MTLVLCLRSIWKERSHYHILTETSGQVVNRSGLISAIGDWAPQGGEEALGTRMSLTRYRDS